MGLPADSLGNPERHAEIVSRVRKLHSESLRQWGRMSPHQAVCHLPDALRVFLGEAPLPPATDNWLNRNIIRRIALHTPVPWPRGGAKAPQGLDPVAGEGTRPGDFGADRDEPIALHARFAALPGLPPAGAHPIFGPLSRNEWMVWAYRYSDRHLRQFGV